MMKAIKFESGHELRDNGVGDFDLYCNEPETFRVGFVPYMLAMVAAADSVCSHCGKPLGKNQDEKTNNAA